MNHHPLTEISIGNFKAFGDLQKIPIKPITLIFGPNSSGKSSIIQSLIFAHEVQVVRCNPDAGGKGLGGNLDIFRTRLGESSVDLGGFRQFRHRSKVEQNEGRFQLAFQLDAGAIEFNRELFGDIKSVTFCVEGDLIARLSSLARKKEKESRSSNSVIDVERQPGVARVSVAIDNEEFLSLVAIGTNNDGNTLLNPELLNFQHPVFQRLVEYTYEQTYEAGGDSFEGYANPTLFYLEEAEQIQATFASTVMHLNGLCGFALNPFCRTQSFWEKLDREFQALHQELVKALSRLEYLGPLRTLPPRSFVAGANTEANWSAGGGSSWDIVMTDRSARDAVNVWLKRLGMPYRFEKRDTVAMDDLLAPIAAAMDSLEQIGSDSTENAIKLVEFIRQSDIRRVSELVLVDEKCGADVTHRDVGVGVSQVIPVLTTALTSRGSLIAMEQPEIHLHPAMQSELADLFIESALGRNKNNFILETHSEHLILRILRRIRETTSGTLPPGSMPINPDAVTVIYVRSNSQGTASVAEVLPITDDGDFSRAWPNGFFTEREKELFEC